MHVCIIYMLLSDVPEDACKRTINEQEFERSNESLCSFVGAFSCSAQCQTRKSSVPTRWIHTPYNAQILLAFDRGPPTVFQHGRNFSRNPSSDEMPNLLKKHRRFSASSVTVLKD